MTVSTDNNDLLALLERVERLEAEVAHLRRTRGGEGRGLHPRLLAHRARAWLRRARVVQRRGEFTDGRWSSRTDWPGIARAGAAKLSERLLNRRAHAYDAAPVAAPAPHRPRVLHVIANVAVGGSTQLMVDLMNRLGHRWEQSVLTSSVPAAHRNMPLTVLPQPAAPLELRRAMEATSPDLIHIHYWGDVDEPWYAAALGTAERSGAPVILNVNTPVAPLRSPAIRTTIYVSKTICQEFGARGFDERVIHPGSHLERFDPRPSPDPDAADAVGMVYRLESDKLNADSIRPLIEIARRRARTRVYVIGQGSLFEPFVAAVRAAGVFDQFVFTGAVPYAHLPGWYGRFSVFVAPVWKESFGQVTPFAMSMGQAVVGTRVGALPEILGGDRWLADTPEAIADLAVRLLDDPALLAQVGAANRARARARFGLDAMIGAYEALYSELAPPADLMPGFPPAQVFAA